MGFGWHLPILAIIEAENFDVAILVILHFHQQVVAERTA